MKQTKAIATPYATHLAPDLDVMMSHWLASPWQGQKRYTLPIQNNARIGILGIMAKVSVNVQIRIVVKAVVNTIVLMQTPLNVSWQTVSMMPILVSVLAGVSLLRI